MVQAAHTANMVEMVSRRSAHDQRRMLFAVVDLCATAPVAKRAQVHAAVDAMFLALAAQAEREIRTYLAKRAASADWAPPSLINYLARDEIAVACLVIQASPQLTDDDLIGLLAEASVEHQIEVARRPAISTAVTEAVLDTAAAPVLAALAGNGTADVSPDGMRRLVDAARRFAAVRAPLARHPRLSQSLAEQLLPFVGQDLRGVISDRFKVDATAIQSAANSAVDWAKQAAARQNVKREAEHEVDARLLAKAQASGELKPDFLVKVLKERRLALFQIALAKLGGFSLPAVKRACNSSDTEALALACAAVGLDRNSFPGLVDLVRALNDGRPAGGWNAGGKAAAAFAKGKVSATRAFREVAGGV
jgi:uncharacterized protein (DUF2336 family)